MRRLGTWVAALMLVTVLAGCGNNAGSNAPAFGKKDDRLKVATSFYPIYEFAHAVGGEKVNLVNLVPPGTEPHEWEPTAAHMKTLNEASLFLYNGAGFEHWVDKTLKSVDSKQLVAVETSHGFDLDDHDHSAEGLDPHVWLDPLGAAHQVEAIRDAMAKADPANKATYEANAAAYIGQLKGLDQEFKSGLAQCKSRTFFTTHSAFGYLAHRYDLEQRAIMGLSPEAEPKPKELAAVVDEAKKANMKYIFFETLVSDKVAKVVAQEVGAQTLVLNPFEGLTDAEIKAGKSYLTVMRENLTNLRTALECK